MDGSANFFMILLGNATNVIKSASLQQNDYITAILPLVGTFVGTIVGGILSYFTTLALSKRDSHSKMEIKRRDQLYIPICSAIEKIKQVSYGTDVAFYGLVIANNINGPEWKEFRKIIKESTLAASRPYLQKSEILLLVEIDKMIDDLYINLDELVNLPEGEFGIFLEDVIKTDVLSALENSPLSMKIIDLDLYDDIDMLTGVLTGESPNLKVSSFRITIENNDENKVEYIEKFISNDLMLSDKEIIRNCINKERQVLHVARKYIEISLQSHRNEAKPYDHIFVEKNESIKGDLTQILYKADSIYKKLISRIDDIS